MLLVGGQPGFNPAQLSSDRTLNCRNTVLWRFTWGQGDELSVIAAVVLGGTSLFGGKGSVIGTIVGAILIGLINNGLILMGLESSQQMIIRGAIIILAVALTGRKAQE